MLSDGAGRDFLCQDRTFDQAVFLQAAALVLLPTAAGAGIVATGLWHSGAITVPSQGIAMYAAVLADSRLDTLLQRLDEDLAAEQRAGGCPRCGGVLHSARYRRKPRGVPTGETRRLSFCCAVQDCRKRATPIACSAVSRFDQATMLVAADVVYP